MAHHGNVLGITGSFGYVGSQVVRRLARSDVFERIVCTDISRPREPLPERFTFHHCDVRDGERLRTIFEREGVDAVLHRAPRAGFFSAIHFPTDVGVVSRRPEADRYARQAGA